VPDLIDFVTTAPQSSRGKESMKLLSRMGDARAAAPLAAQLSEFFVVRDAKAALAALGEIAKPAVLPLYHHEDRNAREAARELLRGYHATDAEILAESLRALGSESTGTRWSAVDYFNTMPIPADQREAVARALRPLVTITQDRLGNSARDAMKKVATQADADFLLELTASTDDATRRFATDLLVDFQDPRVAKPLAVLLSDANESYRAGDALIRLGSLAEPAILPHLRHPDPNTRKRAAEVLGKVGTASSLPALQIVAKDSNFFARVAAENALSAIRARPAPAVPQR
jgi:HEAT repeat protein